MAKENKVKPKEGKHELGGSKDTAIEGIDTNKYDVFTTDKNLAEARAKYPNIDWFACFTIKDKSGKQVGEIAAYTIKFDKPTSGTLYYYYNGTAHSLDFLDADKKGNKNRVKAILTVGDPPIGVG